MYNRHAMIRKRYRRIVLFFGRILLSFAIWDLILPRIGFRSWSKRTRPARFRKSAKAFRSLAIQMGGVLIKVGQFLSTRVDVLPGEVTEELAGLQDEVPAEDYDKIRRVAEGEFGVSLSEKYLNFDEEPLAAASLGQVHRAQIAERNAPGRSFKKVDVVVKVQRPNIEEIIRTDLAALNTVGRWLNKYQPIRRRADVPALIKEFSRILYEEIDYLAEGRNAETFRANFQDDLQVRVPRVFWTHTTKRVLTLENVWDIKITDYEEISKAGIDRKKVASKLLDTYLKQIFQDGFFHADPHPGNLFVRPPSSQNGRPGGGTDWQLTFVDFGMVGRVPPGIKDGLKELLIGVGTKDAARVVKAYQMLDILLPNADLKLIEKAEEKVFDRFWGMSMSEMQDLSTEELREFAAEFRELLYTMPFQIPQDFIYLFRTVGILSGMCTGLDSQFNVWDHLAPFAQKLIAEEAVKGYEYWFEEIKILTASLLSLPTRMETLFTKIERGEIVVDSPKISNQIAGIEGSIQRVVIGIVFAALLSSGVQFYLANRLLIAYFLFGGSLISIFWILYSSSKQ